MNPLGFARPVLVHAITVRVNAHKGDGGDEFRVIKPPRGFADLPQDTWPGEPVLLDWDPPKGPRFTLEPTLNGAVVVRYRRIPVDPPVDGVVVGTGWRYEGVLNATGGYDGRASMAGPRRAVSLYDVALRPAARSGKARVVLVHPKDIEVVTTETQGRGAPAPTRSGVGGRVGTGRLGAGPR